jgi:uncharacterized protein (DUF58 family)
VALAAYGALLDGVRGVRWVPRQRIVAGPTGSHRSRRRGLGPEFTEYRAYRQGDDPRQLDWKLLARTDRAYVRLAEEQAILPTVLVVDASASLAYPVPGFAKWVQACQITVGLAAVAHGSGDPVGLCVATAGGPITVASRTRSGIVAEIADALARVTPQGTSPPVAARFARGARVVVVSDFLAAQADEAALIAMTREMVAAGGDVTAVHVVAREELDPPWRQALVADPEQPSLRRQLLGATRAEYLARFRAWRAELARRWRGAGAAYTLAPTDEPPARIVRRITRGIM